MDDLAWRLHSIPETFWPNPVFFVLPSQIPVECRSRYVSVIQICPGWTISVLPALAHLCYKGISALISISLTGAGSRHGPRGAQFPGTPTSLGVSRENLSNYCCPIWYYWGPIAQWPQRVFGGEGSGGGLKREFVQLMMPCPIWSVILINVSGGEGWISRENLFS